MVSLSVRSQSVPYQGRLTGLPPDQTTGLKTVEIRIFDAPSGGALLWGPKVFPSTPVVDGFFNVALPDLDDSGTNRLAALGSGPAYVELVVGGLTNAPRQQILAVPVALNGVPPGAIISFGGQTNAVPPGWLLCDGREVSRTRYAALYAAVSNAWGNGDGSTSFSLPDLRGQFLRGVDLGTGVDPDSVSRTASASGGNTGNNVGSQQGDVFMTHTHSTRFKSAGCGFLAGQGGWVDYTTIESGASGGKETRPKNAAVNFIIKY